jgi:hypothetical protein
VGENIKEQREISAGIKTAIFRGRKIRKTIDNNEWWFSVVDVVEVLTESVDAGAYWRKLKERLKDEGSEVVTNCHGLKLPAPDGKMRISGGTRLSRSPHRCPPQFLTARTNALYKRQFGTGRCPVPTPLVFPF